MRYLYFLVIAIFLVACSGSDGVEIQSASLKGVKASINEDVAVGSTLSGSLYIENAPYNLADVLIAISGEGSKDFSVKVSSGATTDTFVGTITLIHSLLGKGGTKYSLTATATLDGHSISAPVDISILEVDTRAPDISANPKRQVSWGDDYVLTPTNSGGVAIYHIKNKPSWATFDTATGVLSGTPTLSDLGVTSDINITAVNDEGSSFLNLFNIEVTKRTPPNIESGEAKNLNLNVFNFPFNDEPLWRVSDGSTTKSSEDISFDTKELFIPIMKTGITKSYDKNGREDDNIKDDGYYQKGKSIHRSREGNITTDYVTGLMWNDNAFYERRTVTSAKMYCRTLKAGGYIDWRLPTAKELQSLMIYDGTQAKDIDHFKYLTHVGSYWSSTKTIESSSYNNDSYIEVRFPNFVAGELETKGNHVLCVRKR